MELKLFMINKYLLFILLLFLISCDNNRVKLSENNIKEGLVIEEVKSSPTEFYYGIDRKSVV